MRYGLKSPELQTLVSFLYLDDKNDSEVGKGIEHMENTLRKYQRIIGANGRRSESCHFLVISPFSAFILASLSVDFFIFLTLLLLLPLLMVLLLLSLVLYILLLLFLFLLLFIL